MPADPCLSCGHEHRHHSGLANMIDCDIPGCSCRKFEQPRRLIGYRTADGLLSLPADVEVVYETADIEGNPLPDEQDQAPLSDFQPQAADVLRALRTATDEQLDEQQWRAQQVARDGDVNLIDVLDGQPTVEELQAHLDAYDHAIAALQQVERYRAFVEDIRAALRPGRWRGFDGPDGVSKDDVLGDIGDALAAFDQSAPARQPTQELLGQVERLRQDHGGP